MPPPRASSRLPRRRRTEPPVPALIVAAAVFAAAEIAAGLVLGQFFAWGRAEALLFLAFRPWLLLIAALYVSKLAWRRRYGFYALALAAAGLGESLLLASLGGMPWSEMVRGWGAGLCVAVAIDFLLRIGMRARGGAGRSIAAILVVALFLLGGLRAYEWLLLGDARPEPADERPPLLLMTGLPLVWGEGGPFERESRPAAIYTALQSEFAIRPIDYLDESSLRGSRLLLLAQPRALEPRELVALDAWVRAGGRALILADPHLAWPTRFAPGDARRPPPATTLRPLLEHWGVTLSASPGSGIGAVQRGEGGIRRRLVMQEAGRFRLIGVGCRHAGAEWMVDCEIESGRVRLIADADLMRDALWVGPGPLGAERHARLADNPLLLAAWLDQLENRHRERSAAPVHWAAPGASRTRALAMAGLPLAILLGVASFAARRRRI